MPPPISPADSDAELVRRSRRRPEAFRALYDRHAERIHGFFLRRTRNADAALELTAETFAAAWLGRRRFEDLAGGSAAPWLFGIARNVLAASVRRREVERRARERLGLELSSRTSETADDWLEGLDADLETALAELDDRERRALELRVVDELPYDEVGRRLGISAGAARVRVFRGLRRVRSRLTASTQEGDR